MPQDLSNLKYILVAVAVLTHTGAQLNMSPTSLVPGAEEERLVHTDALPVNYRSVPLIRPLRKYAPLFFTAKVSA